MRQGPNLAARWARWFIRRAYHPGRAWRVFLAVALALIWLVGAEVETYVTDTAAGSTARAGTLLGDLLYAPATFLTPQAEYRAGIHLTPWGEAARLAGGILPALGLFWLSQRRLYVGLARLLLRAGAARHGIIHGRDGSGDALALASAARGDVVVLLDPALERDSARVARLGQAGVIMFDDARPLPERLRDARLAYAHDVASWAGSDVEALADALAIRGCMTAGDILVDVRSPLTQRALRHGHDLLDKGNVRLRPVACEALAIRAALADASLVEEALALGQSRVTLCLWGAGVTMQWALVYALLQNWSTRLGAPRILVAPNSDNAAWAPFLDAIDGVRAHAPSVFEPEYRPAIERAATIAECRDAQVTRHLVDLGDDDATLNLAFELAVELRQTSPGRTPTSCVQPVIRRAEAAPLFDTSDLCLHPAIVLGDGATLATLGLRSRDAFAARLHLHYIQTSAAIPAAMGRWETISETYVHANRASADHAAVKRADRAAVGGGDDARAIEQIAQVEHRRWCMERLLDGWAPAPARDNAARLHPSLVPWAQLRPADQQKDRDQVALVLALGEAE